MPYLATLMRADKAGRTRVLICADGVWDTTGGTMTWEDYRRKLGNGERVVVRLPSIFLRDLAAVRDL